MGVVQERNRNTYTRRHVVARAQQDYRFYAADADLDRANRLLGEAERLELSGRYMLGRAARVDASHLYQRHKDYLIIDPEAKL